MSVLDNIIKMRNDIKQVYDKAIDVKRGSRTSLQVMDKSISQLKDLFFKFVSVTDYGRTCDKNLDNYIEYANTLLYFLSNENIDIKKLEHERKDTQFVVKNISLKPPGGELGYDIAVRIFNRIRKNNFESFFQIEGFDTDNFTLTIDKLIVELPFDEEEEEENYDEDDYEEENYDEEEEEEY